MIPWDFIYLQFAKARNWLPEQVNRLTIRQLRVLTMNEGDAQSIGSVPTKTRNGRKAIIEPAVANLIAGRRWDAR